MYTEDAQVYQALLTVPDGDYLQCLASPCILYAGHYYLMAFLGIITGRRLLHRLNEETVRKAVLAALLFVGLKMFFDNMRNIY